MSILNYNSEVEILLVQPEYGEEVKKRIFQPGLEFPYNLTCLSSYIEKEGIRNEIFDWRIHENPTERFIEVLKKLKPQVVGITSVTSGMKNAAKIAKIVKETDKNITTIIGGCHASALPEETLNNYPDFDYLVHGEGEIALTNLMKALNQPQERIQDLKGIAFRKKGNIKVNPREDLIHDLDIIPLPARHKIDIYRYAPNPGTRNYLRLPSTGFSIGRGCPYNCQFCYKGVWGKSVRFRSIDNVISEIEECISKYQIHDFRFYDDVLTFPKWDISGFCNKIIENNIDISWSCWSRVNDVNYEKLILLKKAGCYNIKYGIEFGTEKALKLSKKGIKLEQSREAIEMTKEVGIECKGSFVFGIPGETIEDCKKTIEFALSIAPDFATFYAYDSIPGSKFYQLEMAGTAEQALSTNITKVLVSEAYKRFYLRPTFILQRIKNVFVHPKREIKALFDGMKMMLVFFLRKGGVI
ncbi:MAG: B12-binding domain-containing radical SAM protein [Planctomycetota bacterium]|jgi:radical SAM superfamily enzyme YgiQ (UPF0313 family)